MTVETANASWHPAFMPNADAPAPEPAPAPAEDVATPIATVTSTWPSEEAADDAADDWPVFEQPATAAPTESKEDPEEGPTAPVDEPATDPSPQAATEQDAPSVESTKPSGRTPGHTSNDSFTRTVAHDVNWDDDQDTEWTLSRTDTDPFKFLPPSDRTNSFPPVPPVTGAFASAPAPGEEQLLPSNEAEDLMNEIDNMPEQPDPFGDGPEGDHQYVGRDATDHEALGSRYEEGVPLIAQSESNGDAPQQTQTSGGFGDDTADDDDFFSQIQKDDDADFPAFGGNQPLERKSTMQVLGNLNSALSRVDTLDDMLEEEEEEEAGAEVTQPTEPSNGSGVVVSVPDTTQPEDADTKPEDADAKPADDLAAKWEQAFADEDDDDFLLDEAPAEGTPAEGTPVDPAAFFGSDDEGFLEDDDEPQAPPATATLPAPANAQGRYAPQAPAAAPQRAVSSTYAPAASPYAPAASFAGQRAQSAAPAPYQAQNLRPEPPKAQSFAAQSKGGYTSPYDLPMEVVVPKKRASTQQAPRSPSTGPPALAPPPRTSSMQSHTPPPPRAATSSISPPTSSHSLQPSADKSAPTLRNKGSFFEELPMASKPRSASRQSHRIPSPTHSGPPEPLGPPPLQAQLSPSLLSPPMVSPSAPDMARSASGGIPHLVPGERVNPYAPQPAQQQASGIPSNARYSPAPPAGPATNGSSRPPSNNRYSPAPTGARPPVPAFHSPPAVLPHLPRTSSPLAHFEVSRDAPLTNGDQAQADRRSSYSLEPRLTRVSSLPTTREVEEEDDSKPQQMSQPPNIIPAESRYSPAPPAAARQTPPPSSHGPPMHSTLSPSKRTNSSYLPQAALHDSPPENRFAPPPRSQTQSPGSSHGRPPSQPVARPSSVHSPTSPRAIRSFQPAHAPVTRPRGASQNLNVIAPTDGRENDPLQRWKGAPIISWGVGGTIITSFPKNVPRYGIGQTAPVIIRSPGEVHVKHVKDIQPLEERLAKFPGPLRGKSKKKETVAWLTSGIETLEKELPDMSFQTQLSHEQKRAVERVLLWKILRIFIESDGVLEGSAAVDKAVRDVLAPGLTVDETEPTPGYGAAVGAEALHESSATQMKADAVDSSTMDRIRNHLSVGEREKAVWAAVDKRLWGHAMLISNTVSPDLYKQVAQEFVRKEVNYPGHNNESIAALYKVLSGNFDDCVDELVPVHARAGFQLVNTTATAGPTKDATEGLDKWRETLGLVLSNRSTEDVRALNALGNLLSSYGRAEAAHICFLFGRKATIFGGLDDTNSNFVLVGADHKTQGEQFAKETEALLLSEVYEYGLSLSGTPVFSAGVPHLAAYKLQHAMTLAEYGMRDKALQYCEVIAGSITAQTKRSPYHHPILETAVENLRARLKQAPKEESSSWISKPSMNKVSDSVWSRFNKFVAGDENDSSAAGGSAEGGAESGPFARVAGTPTISRSPSVSNFEPIYGGAAPPFAVGSPPAAVPVPATRAASRYAPMASQAPTPSSSYEPGPGYTPAPASVGRSSNEFSRNPYAPRTSMDSQPGYTNGGYVPQNVAEPAQGYGSPAYGSAPEVPAPVQPGTAPLAPVQPPTASPYQGYDPYGASQTAAIPPAEVGTPNTADAVQASNDDFSNAGYQPPSYGYEPPSMVPSSEPEPQSQEAAGYEPPTFQPYSYEPPSYNPEPLDNNNNDNDDEAAERKPKPKSFMDDDDDDIPGLKALKPQEKSKSEKDKENEEMFRKAAEEDAKRAAAAQQQPKKGWGFGSWFGGSKKEATPDPAQPNKPIKAKLGEANNFVYDPDLKRWINKAAGADAVQAKTATPPPPRGMPRSSTGTPPPPRISTPPMGPMGRASAPPGGPPGGPPGPDLAKAPSSESLGAPPPPMGAPGPPGMVRSVSNTSAAAGGPLSGPPSRPATSMSNASSIDDLLSAGPRKGAKKKKGGRYVDVMAK
ncbi:COPII coat assembly protein SEC16 [Colletotrichum sojae]|uniref:Protein transport protein sec16 n=1 Tax=Colletotrichum sojae TaxID=2175907 RepID=A0A8H6MTH5_9PEZI|nr:COPII coat assembly protein SEC16 [Colletotrichum sojae]